MCIYIYTERQRFIYSRYGDIIKYEKVLGLYVCALFMHFDIRMGDTDTDPDAAIYIYKKL